LRGRKGKGEGFGSKMSTFMKNPHGCSMKENENGTSIGRGRGFLPLYVAPNNKNG